MKQGAGYADLLAHPARIAGDQLVRFLGHVQHFHQVISALHNVVLGQIVQPTHEAQKFPSGELLVQHRRLGDVANGAAGDQ